MKTSQTLLYPALVSAVLIALFGCHRGSTKTTPAAIDEAAANQTLPALSFTALLDGMESAALPRRLPGEDTRFRSMDAARTGLDFAHNWSPPPGYQLEIYNSLPGGGVCIGDFDADGWPDVFLSQPYVGSRLYKNLGNWRFRDVTPNTIGDVPKAFGAAFVDIDNDGDLDLYVCNDERPNNLFINDGQGHFAERAREFGLDFNGASVMMAFADFDRDGDLDGYLVTNRKEPAGGSSPNSESAASPEFTDVIVSKDGQSRVIKAAQYDHLYRNNGDGTFTDVSQASGITGNYWGLAATWWDYDRDGWPDLYVSNDFYSPDQLYRNNGDGTFTDVTADAVPHTPWYSMGSDVADINNDGWLDLMGSDMSGTSHYKQKASMGDMSTTGWFLTHPTPRQYMRNALYLNTGTSRFLEIAQLAGLANTDWTWSLKFGDLDEDGWTDLFVTNGMNRDWTNSDLRNKSNLAASPEEKMQIWLESPQRRDPNMVFRNGGDLRFKELGASWGLGGQHVSYGAALADLDRDGDLDLIVNHAEEAVGVYQNQTVETHRVLLRLVGKQSNRWGVGATVVATTNDGKRLTRYLNTAQGFMASNEPLVHFGLGQSDRWNLQVTWPSGQRQAFQDLPADRFYVIHESAPTEGISDSTPQEEPLFVKLPILEQFAHQETPFNDYARQPLLPVQHSQLGPALSPGDVDRDGDVDIVVGGASGQPARLLINDRGVFRSRAMQSFSADADFEDMGLLLFDADGDDDLDLYVVSGGVEAEARDPILQDRLYHNDGHGVFSRTDDQAVPQIDHSGSVVRGHDYDRDGDVDLFVGGRVIPGQYPLTPSSYLLQNSRGEFIDATDTSSAGLRNAGLVTDAVWADVDGDGWTDLVLSTEWGPVKLFRNERGRLVEHTAAAGLSSRLGWWNSIAASDLDADGDLDLVVGNLGWNTKYHASEQQPTLLYYGDFERTGRMRLVEAEYEDETLFPVRGKSCSTNAMPFLGEKFGKFHDFAVASLDEIYTSTCLDNSHRYAANTLESGVLINDGDCQFEFVPLPTLAQVSPARAILAHDFNDDGHLDLFLAQNFFGPQPETGRFDGGVGLVLAGMGDGTFRAMMPRESGIVVPGDATAAVLADLDQDGRTEIIVTTNDGPIYTFKRTTP